MFDKPAGWRSWLWFLRSRKVQTAFVTVIAAFLADRGLGVSEETIGAIIAVGVAVILGIAHEDNGDKTGLASSRPEQE